MAPQNWKKVHDVIDDYIGGGGLPSDVLDFIRDAMLETANHLRANWQDASSAKVWESGAAQVDRLVASLKQKRL